VIVNTETRLLLTRRFNYLQVKRGDCRSAHSNLRENSILNQAASALSMNPNLYLGYSQVYVFVYVPSVQRDRFLFKRRDDRKV